MSFSSSCLSLAFSAKGTRLEGDINYLVIFQHWLLITDLLGGFLSLLQRHLDTPWWVGQAGISNLSAPQHGCLKPATHTKFSGCILRSAMCWLAVAPGSGINFSFTTTNSKEYFLPFLGFQIVTPSRFNSGLFHIDKTFLVGLISSCPTYFAGSTLKVAPQSTWKRIAFPFRVCVNFLRIFTVFDCTNRIGC